MQDSQTPPKVSADPFAARQLALGRVLIPYWGYNKQGRRVPLSCWGTLLPGETLSQAAARLSAAARKNVNSSVRLSRPVLG